MQMLISIFVYLFSIFMYMYGILVCMHVCMCVGVQLCMCVHVCVCMGTQVGCTHLCACVCGSLRLVLGIIFHPFSTLYIETGFLIQNQRFN